MDSMTLLIGRRPRNGRRGMLAERDPIRRPVRRENLADEVRAGDRAPDPRVTRLRPVVPHDEVLPRRNPPLRVRLEVALVARDVRRLVELPAVDEDLAVALLPRLAGERDDPLHERSRRGTVFLG